MGRLDTAPVKESVPAFLGYLSRKNKTANTVKRWQPELRRFAEWAGNRSPGQISARDVELDYLIAWERDFERRNDRKPSPQTVRATIQALRSFYAFLDKFDFLPGKNPMNAIDAPEVHKKVNDWLKPEEDSKLLDSSLTIHEDAIIFTLRLTGMRLGEALSLLNVDVDLEVNTIYVRTSKTQTGLREIPIAPELRPHLLRWISYTTENGWYYPNGPFFVTRNLTFWKAQQAEKIVSRAAERAGIRRVTPHTLRRTFGSDLLNRGARLEIVSKLLGHANTAITEQSYAEMQNQTIRAEFFKALAEGEKVA